MAPPHRREAFRPERVTLRTARLEAFSDGVFAIAITLLVLEISVRGDWVRDPLRAVLDLWPEYLAYLVSFSTIGALWLGHSVVTEHLLRSDRTLARLNLLLLLAVAFLPFPTGLVGQFISQDAGERVATTFLGLNLLAASSLLSVTWRYARNARLVDPEADDDELELVTRRLTPGLAGYVLLIGLGLLFPVAAVIGYLVVAVGFVMPIPRRRRRRAD